MSRIINRVFLDRERLGHLDMEASEIAIRSSMHSLGGTLLEKLVNTDNSGYCGPHLNCNHGHQAEFVAYRDKQVTTVLSKIKVNRAYYHCDKCEKGIIPKDRNLDIEGTSFSPGVRRMMGRVGGKEPFKAGQRDLEELAGVVVNTKEVERISEEIGEQIEVMGTEIRKDVLMGKVITFKSVPKMYIAIDGTGVPMVPHETEGRLGKDEGQKAKTREVKLGCVFTQTSVDEKGFPIRDEGSTTYVGAIEAAEEFGPRIYAEAMCRGVNRAEKVSVLGDGAPWIWNIADEHFHGATQIVDIYHAREHIADLSKVIYGPTSAKAKEWSKARSDELDKGDVEEILSAFRRLRPKHEKVKEEVRKALGYFDNNKERMRYGEFRSQGLFIGSGVMEAGCKTIVGLRLKQSGMHWTVRGANAIISLRCCELSGRWEDFWGNRASA